MRHRDDRILEADAPRILILKTGSTFPAVRRRFGDFDRWFLDALRGSPASFTVRDVTEAPPPPLDGFDGVIVTGSPAGVYENRPWMAPLAATLRRIVERQDLPALCVCFGAQALAAALGGRVARSPLGWEIGTVTIRRTPEGRRDRVLRGGDASRFQATHQDWIATLPVGAVVLAENDMSPWQAFRVGDTVWATQFHPEATPAILEALLQQRREILVAERNGRGPRGEAGYLALLRSLEPTPEGPALLARFVGLVARRPALPPPGP